MATRIVHTADWHVGATRNLPGYLDRQAKALDELVEKSRELDPDVVCITGDLFDCHSPTEEERCLVVKAITDLLVKLPNATIIVVGGNHDWNRQNSSMLESLDISYRIAGTRFKIVYEAPKLLEVNGAYFMCIPCQQDLTADRVREIVDRHYEDVPPAAEFIVCMHECFKSYNDMGKPVGKETLPDMNCVKYWLLGDIHKHQFIMDNAWYCGSLLQTDFGESPVKGFVYVDKKGPRFVEVESPRKLVTVEQGDEIPEDAFVRYKITDLLTANRCELPSNVVAMTSEIKAAVVDTTLFTDDVTDGLAEFMAEKYGYDRDAQRESVEYVKNLLEEGK